MGSAAPLFRRFSCPMSNTKIFLPCVVFCIIAVQTTSKASQDLIQPKSVNPSHPKVVDISAEVARRIAIHSSLPARSPFGIGLLGEGMDTNSATMESLMQTLAIELSSSKALGSLRALVEVREAIKEQTNLTQSSDPEIAKMAADRLKSLEGDKSALLSSLLQAFRSEGFELTPEQVDALAASPNAEDLASLITSFQALRQVTLEMEDRLRASPGAENAQRYYGSYSVLLLVMDKIQKNAISNIKNTYIPKADALAEEAQHVIDDARNTLQRARHPDQPLGMGEREILELNIASSAESRLRAKRLRGKLEKNLEILVAANKRLANSIDVAKNSHRAMLVKKEIDQLDLLSTREFEEIQNLILPPMAALNFADPDRPEVSPRKQITLD